MTKDFKNKVVGEAENKEIKYMKEMQYVVCMQGRLQRQIINFSNCKSDLII
jgi:hypothetical protein